MPHCVTAKTIPFCVNMNARCQPNCHAELLSRGHVSWDYHEVIKLRVFTCITSMECLVMFPIFTIINLITSLINLIMSLWAAAQSSRDCGCLAPLWAWLAHRRCFPQCFLTESEKPKQLTVLGNEVNTDGEL